MKSFVAKAALVLLPLAAFSSQSFAAQELVVAATNQQETSRHHDVKHTHEAHKKDQKEGVALLSDDESIAGLSSIKELKKRYQE